MSDNKKTVIALGYFDSVHKGHVQVMERGKRIAKELCASFSVFTFEGDLKSALGLEDSKNVYLPYEREKLMRSLGAEQVFFAPVDKQFLSLNKTEFLDLINEKFDIAGYVCGKDYRFGKNGEGDTTFLSEYAKSRGQVCSVVEILNELGDKISTSRIKKLLLNGEIDIANNLLGRPFFVSGSVCCDRQVGRTIGFPTVNIKLDSDKFQIKFGVYKGHVFIDGIRFSAIINYGARPTFNLDGCLVEAHIVDFNGDLYNKNLTIYFDEFIRDIKKFSCIEDLKIQLGKDVERVKNGRD